VNAALEQTDLVQLGDRLRMARSQAGLTQEQAAKAMDMARTTLVAVEKGQRRIRPEELDSFSRAYGISVNSLFRTSAVRVDLLPRFRSLAEGSHVGTDEAARLLNDLTAAEVELERLVGRTLKRDYPAERSILPGDVREQAEDLAGEMRQRLGLGLAPIVDIVSMLETEVGVRVFIRPLKGAVSGLFVYDEEIGACMLLNQNHPRERRALTAAHEFAHLISARREPDVVEATEGPRSRTERFATAFSLSFVMPASVVRNRFREIQSSNGRFSPRHLVLMAHALHVSSEAMCRRLEDLKLLPEGTWESLKSRGFSGQLVREILGDRRREDDVFVPPRLWSLAAEAHERNLLTEGQLAELLRMERRDIRRLLDMLGSDDNDDLGPSKLDS
jgi:Zn-dependent peptidase ImmA (M78 family)/transcriptional regulator with XRE-family HTH domain